MLLPSPKCGAPGSSGLFHVKWRRGATTKLRTCAAQQGPTPQVDQAVNPLVAAMKPSKTMALTDLASSMREAGLDVISLSVGQPDFQTPAAICAAAKAAIDAGKTKYTPNAGTAALRSAIVAKLRTDNGLEYAADEIVVSNGAKQSIWQAVFLAISPGDEVIVPAPYWVSYPEMVRLAGGTPVIVPTRSEDDYCLTAEALRTALTPRTRALILCSPSNPTGTLYSRSALEALAQVARSHPRLLIISDEIYELLVYPPSEHTSVAALPGMWERTLTVNGVSKAYAMTGWRIGYLAAPRHFARAAAGIQSQSTSGACSVSQEAAVAALELGPAGGTAVAGMVREFERRRDYVLARLMAIPGLRVPKPQGAFYIFPNCSSYFGAGVRAESFGDIPDVDALCRYLLESGQVALVPGDAFGDPDCIRFSFAASLDMLKEAMRRIEAALAHIHGPAL